MTNKADYVGLFTLIHKENKRLGMDKKADTNMTQSENRGQKVLTPDEFAVKILYEDLRKQDPTDSVKAYTTCYQALQEAEKRYLELFESANSVDKGLQRQLDEANRSRDGWERDALLYAKNAEDKDKRIAELDKAQLSAVDSELARIQASEMAIGHMPNCTCIVMKGR